MTKMTVKEAMNLLTLGEIKAIEKHEGKTIGSDGFGNTSLLGGVVWAFERRKALAEGKTLTTWEDIDNYTLKALDEYFDADEEDAIPSEPDSDSGKDS